MIAIDNDNHTRQIQKELCLQNFQSHNLVIALQDSNKHTPISIMGFDLKTNSSLIREPNPPANNTPFINFNSFVYALLSRLGNAQTSLALSSLLQKFN